MRTKTRVQMRGVEERLVDRVLDLLDALSFVTAEWVVAFKEQSF